MNYFNKIINEELDQLEKKYNRVNDLVTVHSKLAEENKHELVHLQLKINELKSIKKEVNSW